MKKQKQTPEKKISSDSARTFYYTEDLQNREFMLSFGGPWSPMVLRMMLNRAAKGLRAYKRELVKEDRKNVRETRSDTAAG